MTDDYQMYLRSEHWHQMREKRLLIDKHKCAFCGGLGPLHVHHRTYERLGNEDVYNDLVTLCHDCHHKLHELIDAETPYVNGLYEEWKEEASAALKTVAEKYIDKQTEHLVKMATPFVIHNGWRNKPTILSVVEDSFNYDAGRMLYRKSPWRYNNQSIYVKAMKQLPKKEK